MTRVLLTSVVRPFGGPGEGDSVGAELFHAQVTRAQGAFSPRQVIRVWGLDLIAENIDAPTVVLHYPSMAELERELRAGEFTHVGVNFVVATFHKVRAMVAMIRRVAPGARVILGGYGTVLPDEVLLPHGDFICREEGVAFMRRILGEPAGRPIRAAHALVPAPRVLGYQLPTVVGHVTAGLGCANGCDFCSTSHFFRRSYVRLRGGGDDIYQALIETRDRARREGYEVGSFSLIDEDFFLDKKRAEQLLEAVRRGGQPLSIFGFGSVKGLSQFRASEIAEMGFDMVWTAFEGRGAGYDKLRGRDIAELYRDLKANGVGLLSSMIIGFSYQDEATVRAEFEELMRLEPSLVQILIYFAFPGTPFFRRVLDEGRFLPQYATDPDLRRWDGFSMHLRHPHFTPERLEGLQRALYREDYRRLGPSLHRLTRVWLDGAEALAKSKSALLRARAAMLRATARSVLPTLGAPRWLLPSREARLRAAALERDILAATGRKTLAEHLLSPATLALGAFTGATARLGVLQQPSLLRVEHRLDGVPMRSDPIMALHGSGASVLSRLREDAHDLLDRLRAPSVPPIVEMGPWRPIPAARGSIPPAPWERLRPVEAGVGVS